MVGRHQSKVRRFPVTTTMREESHAKLVAYCTQNRVHRNVAFERAVDVLTGALPPANGAKALPPDLQIQIDAYCKANSLAEPELIEYVLRKHLAAQR